MQGREDKQEGKFINKLRHFFHLNALAGFEKNRALNGNHRAEKKWNWISVYIWNFNWDSRNTGTALPCELGIWKVVNEHHDPIHASFTRSLLTINFRDQSCIDNKSPPNTFDWISEKEKNAEIIRNNDLGRKSPCEGNWKFMNATGR